MQATTRHRASARTIVATVLIAAAIASLALTSLIHSNRRATAQSDDGLARARVVVPLSVPLDSGEVGPFAFGYVEFDQDPTHGVAGFSAWPRPRLP